MYKIILPLVFGLFQLLNANSLSNFCATALMKCEDDMFNCAIDYGQFLTDCDLRPRQNHVPARSDANLTVFVAPPSRKPCTHECVEAIERLKRTKRGKVLQNCDCRLDGKCLVIKARVAKCLSATKRRTISCTLALWNCSRNLTCASLQDRFLEDCHEMINGVKCEKKCQDIQQRLYNEAKELADCECDGPTENYCRAIRAHSKQLECEPGMDRDGERLFIYTDSDSEILGGSEFERPKNPKGVGILQRSSRTLSLVVLLLTIFLL